MKESKTRLSICIPTFNRLHYLKESLDSLLPEAQRLDVQVCVSDNHSIDGTSDYLKEMAERFSCLQYRIQSENIGLDRNMLSVIFMGTGQYIFPLGDDDYLPEGAVEQILTTLDEGLDLIILDGWHTNAVLLQTRRHLSPELQGLTFSEPSAALDCLWDKMPFGSFLVDRECLLPEYSQPFIGTSHAYSGAIWTGLAEKYLQTGACKVKCMSSPTVMLREGEKSWRKEAAHIIMYEAVLWFRLVVKIDAYKFVAPRILSAYTETQVSLIKLLSYRASGQLDKNLVDSLVGMYTDHQINLMRKVIILPSKPLDWALTGYFETKRLFKRIIRR